MAKQTKGYCKYCGKEYTRGGMLRHLAACKERKAAMEGKKNKNFYYELVISAKYNKDYWLIIQISENATLEYLDHFIRDIWVECCGHLSAFHIAGEQYEVCPDEDPFWGEPAKNMDYKLKDVLECGMKFGYEYDFGSTTELEIQVQDYYEDPGQKEALVILSRNNPIQYICGKCGKNVAAWVAADAMYYEDLYWCEDCYNRYVEGDEEAEADEEPETEYEDDESVDYEEEDEFWGDDYMPEFFLPVCNSPRRGVCGYTGSERYPDQFEPDKKK